MNSSKLHAVEGSQQGRKIPWLGIYAASCFLLSLLFVYRAVVPENNSFYAKLAFGFLVLTVLLGVGHKLWTKRIYADQLAKQDSNRLHGRDRALAIILTFSYLYAAGLILNVFSAQHTSRNAYIAGGAAIVVSFLAIWAARDHWGVAQGGFGGIAGLALLRVVTSGDRLALVVVAVCFLIVLLLIFAEQRTTRRHGTGYVSSE